MSADTPRQAGVPGDAELLCWHLARHDAECPVCRYSLRLLAGTTCPECSAKLRLEVGSPQVRFGAWVFAMVSLAMGAGFDWVVSSVMSAALAWNGPGPPAIYRLLFVLARLAGLGLLSTGGLIVLYRARARWMKMAPDRQRAAAAAIFAGVFAVHAAVGAWIAFG